jgi:hypothetical protein
MEAKGADTYIVYCNSEQAQQIISSGETQKISRMFGVGVEYKPGFFLIHRQDANKYSHQSAKHMLIMTIQQTLPTNPDFQWFWFNGHYWRQYDSDSNQKIEDAFQQRLASALLNVSNKVYQIDLRRMVQSSNDGRFWNIMRTPLPQPTQTQPPFKKKRAPRGWAYRANNYWRNVPATVSDEIDSQISEGKRVFTVSFEGEDYEINLDEKVMRDSSRQAYPLKRNN